MNTRIVKLPVEVEVKVSVFTCVACGREADLPKLTPEMAYSGFPVAPDLRGWFSIGLFEELLKHTRPSVYAACCPDCMPANLRPEKREAA